MSIQLANVSDHVKKIQKTVRLGSSISCNFKDSVNMLSPDVLIDKNDYGGENYCYISDFQRYYFITDYTYTTGGIVILHCKCDVLKSHETDILDTAQMIIRYSDSEYYKMKNNMIQDKKIPLQAKKLDTKVINTDVGEINSIQNMLTFVLTTMGGTGQQVKPTPTE